MKYFAFIILFGISSQVMASGYGMVGIGKTDYDADAISSFDNPMGFDFIVGFDSSPGVAFEIGMVLFGDSSDGIPPEFHIEINGLVLSGLFKTNLNPDTELFLQLGLNMWDAEFSVDGFGAVLEDDGNDLFYGFGISTKVNEKVSLGARYNSYDIDGDDVTRITVNAQLAFE